MSKPRRPRTERRVAERAARGLVRDKERLFALERGGSRERPVEVVSSSVIEGRAEGWPCPQCGGALRVEEHRAESWSLRAVDVRCALCGVARTLWFRVGTAQAN